MTTEYGLFNDESANYTEGEAVEAGFYSREDALQALAERYTDDDDLIVHEVEPDEDEEEDEDSDDDEDDEDDEDDCEE